MNVLPFFMGARSAPNIADLFSITLDTAANLDGVSTTGWDLLVGKSRANATDWAWRDSAQGISDYLKSNAPNGTDVAAAFSDYATLLGSGNAVLYRFKKSPGFCDLVTYTGTGGGRTLSHNLGVEPGLIIVKATSATGNWRVYHRTLGNTVTLLLDSPNAVSTASTNWWNNTSPTASEFTVGNSNNADTVEYVAYLFAHDTSASGIVQCGSYTEPSGGNFVDINLGWPPQFLLAKASSALADWVMVDAARGMEIGTATKRLFPNLSNAEASGFANGFFTPISTGFTAGNTFVGGGGATVIYMAIRAES